MNNSLLFNNIHYNKIIKKKNIFDHPHKNLFINIFILLFFIIILGLFLSYRYKCKQNIINHQKTVEEKNEIENKIENEIEEKNNLKKNNINIEKKTDILLDTISVKNNKNILLDIQNNNFGNNQDDENLDYHLI